MILQLMILGISEFAIDMDASFEQKRCDFLKLIDKERDFEHLEKNISC